MTSAEEIEEIEQVGPMLSRVVTKLPFFKHSASGLYRSRMRLFLCSLLDIFCHGPQLTSLIRVFPRGYRRGLASCS